MSDHARPQQRLKAIVRALRSIGRAIATERDADTLAKRICTSLVSARGFFAACIVHIDAHGVTHFALDGEKARVEVLDRFFSRGDLPSCLREVLDDGVATQQRSTCTDCHVDGDDGCGLQGEICLPIACDPPARAALMVILPSEHLDDPEELELLVELCDDIAFALRGLERDARLHENEQIVREAGRIAKVGGWTYDPVRDVGTYTDGVAQILEVPPASKLEQPLDLSMYQGESRDTIERAMRTAIEKAEPYDTEVEVVCASGQHKWIRNVGIPTVVDGRVVRVRGMCQDVTATRLGEIALHERLALQEKFSRVAESVPGVICAFQLKPSGAPALVFATSAMEEMMGIDARELSTSHERWVRNLSSDDARRMFATLKISSERLTPWHEQFHYRHPVLGLRCHEVWGVPHKTSDGATEWDGFVMDITERRNAERALAKSEEMYRQLFGHMLNGLAHCEVIYDGHRPVDWRYLRVNAAFEQETGLAGIEGKLVSEAVPGLLETDADLAKIYFRVARTGNSERFEMYLSSMNDWFSVAVYSSTPGQFVSLFEVITDRKRMEAALRESEAKIRILFDHAPVGILQVDPTRDRRIRVNQRFCDLTGYGEAELLTMGHASIYRAEDATKRAELLAAVAAGTVATLTSEISLRRKDGTEIWVNETVSRTEQLPSADATVIVVIEDITQRRAAEASLRLQTSALRAAANGIVITEPSGKIIQVNPAFCKLTGYPESEILGADLRILRSEKQDNVFYASMWRTILAGGVWRGELVNRRRDGSTYHEEMTITPVVDPVGGVTHFIAIKQDISDRKRSEKIVRETQERQKIALDAAGQGTWSREFAANTVTLDDRAQALLDFDTSVVRDDQILQRCHPNDLAALHGAVASAIESGTERSIELVHRIVRRDGAIRWVAHNVRVLYELVGGQRRPITAVGISRDITEARAAETELRASEERYRTLVDNIDGLVYTSDNQGIVTFVSRGVERFGYTPEQVVGRDRSEFLHPDDRERVLRVRLEQTPSGVFPPLEYRFLDAHGKPRPVRSSFHLLKRDGEIVGATGVLTDLTNLREAEEQLRAAQKMEAVGRLAGGVAHDFNNLLSVILSYSELALMGLGTDDPLRSDLNEVIKASKRAETLTRQLLAFSRRQVLRPEPLDPVAIVEGMENLFRRLLGEDIQLEIRKVPGWFRIYADRGQIEQVLMNLLVNARDAMPDGGRISLVVQNRSLDATAAVRLETSAGDYVEIEVSDTGIGMDAQTLSMIFEPFFTTKGVGKGTGLGLSTVYGIVRQSAGAIEVSSTPGAGTTFKIYLPRHRGDLELKPDSSRKNINPFRGVETILLVEDEAALRSITERVLKSAGYRVYSAPNAETAIELCEKYGEQLHLLLTDVVMPGLNGRDLAERVTSMCSSLRVIFMSGYPAEVLARHKINELDFLAKPFDIKALTSKVREVLDRDPTTPVPPGIVGQPESSR